MIKHSVKDGLVYLSIDKMDFSYRIPIKKTGNKIDWRIGAKGTEGIVFKGVSKWTLQLFTKKNTEDKYIQQFKSIVLQHCPNNTIDWEETLLAVDVQNEYNILSTAVNAADGQDEIISTLKTKYKLDEK